MEEEDFEESWDLLERDPKDFIVRDAKLKRQLEEIAQSALADLQEDLSKHQRATLTTELLSEMVVRGVQIFMQKWEEALRAQNLAGLIEIVLEGQSLTPKELKGFIRALPESLLTRIVESAVGPANGVHALMAIEKLHRSGTLREDYKILKNSSGRVYVSVPQDGDQVIDVFLDDTFQGLDSLHAQQ